MMRSVAVAIWLNMTRYLLWNVGNPGEGVTLLLRSRAGFGKQGRSGAGSPHSWMTTTQSSGRIARGGELQAG